MDGLFIFAFYIIVFIIVMSTANKNEEKRDRGSSKSKYNKLYTTSKVILTFGIVANIVFCGMLVYHIYRTSDLGNSSEADGFTIDNYNVALKVSETNTIEVTEKIGINFYETGHHGIYKFVPTWLKYTNKENITQSKKAIIESLRAEGENYTVDTVKKEKQRIKIGNAYMTLPIGLHNYKIMYNYVMGPDTYKGFDELIFHAYGDYWGTQIKKPTLEIQMPKEFNSDGTIHFFADKNRKKDITSYVEYRIEGNTIYAQVLPTYQLNKALTVDIELPEGYFVNGQSDNYGNTSFFLCMICIVTVFMTFLLWAKHGKDLDKVPETVEFYPPGNLDAAQIGYISKGDTGRKLSIALIVELASKGYIKIVENDGHRIIYNNYITDVNTAIGRQINITKVKDYTQKILTLHPEAQSIMEKYFPNELKESIIATDFDKFYEEADFLISNGYIKVDHDTINDYTTEDLEKTRISIEKQTQNIKGKLTTNERIVYEALFNDGNQTDLSTNYTFYKTFAEVSTSVRSEYDDILNDIPAYISMLISSILFLIATITLGISYSKIHDISPQYSFMYGLALISNIGTFLLTILMKRKNAYGEQLIARVNGFKNYLELAEKEQIEAAVEQNPNYFFDILPYAYVFGISKKWIEKFENIPIPQIANNLSGFDYTNIDSIDSLSNDIYTPPTTGSGGSSGCSSCGGGCSSCGGGCSSCGGGGSW